MDLETEWPGRIEDFSLVRNSFLKGLYDDEWILWKSRDEEIPLMLRRYLDVLKPSYPYYWIRRVNLHDGRYVPAWNPEYSPHLVSNRVRYTGRLHEHVEPRKPHGTIDIPIIHNHIGGTSYSSGWKGTRAYMPIIAVKKAFQTMKYGC